MELAEKKGIEIISSGSLKYEDKNGVHIKAYENFDMGIEAARKAEVAIVFVKADSGEEYAAGV